MPTAVAVTAVPIVVASTTDDYFVLYVKHDVDGTEVELPVLVKLGEAGTTTLAENVAALPAERYRVEKYQVADPADVDGDCDDDLTELDDLPNKNPVNPAPAIPIRDGAAAIPDRNTFETLSTSYRSSPSTVRDYGKFILNGWGTDRPDIYFVNTKTYQQHDDFPYYLGPEVSRSGDIAYDPDLVAPNGSQGVYFLWFRRGGSYLSYSFGPASYVYTLLAASLPLLNDNLVLYIPKTQLQSSQPDLPLYRQSRIALLFDEDLFSESGFSWLNPAVGYGRLQVRDLDQRPHPRDVVLYEALPTELPRVAGIISTVPQTPLSHVNLRAIQDGIPNAYIRDIRDRSDFNSLLGGYVRYEVTKSGYSIRVATLEEVDAHYEASRPAQPQTPERDLSVTTITPLSEIEFGDWKAFGVKAANVAVLGTLGFPAGTIPEGGTVPVGGTVPDGFAIPFYFYDTFMQETALGAETVFGDRDGDKTLTLAAETTLVEVVEAILADSNFQVDFEVQDEMLDDLRDAIKDAETPPVDHRRPDRHARGVSGRAVVAVPVEHEQRRSAGL